MARISESLDTGRLASADRDLGKLGIQPFFIPTLKRIDVDVDALLEILDTCRSAAEIVRQGGAPLGTPVGGPGCWEGEDRDQADAYRECVAQWWQKILDFLLGIVDWIVQLIDWILDALRLICQVLVWLAAWVAAIVTALAFMLMATGVGAAAVLVLGKIFTIAGAVGVLSFILGALLKLLDYLIEWLQGLIRSGRDSLCGGGIIPRTPDWDPTPLPLPTWPF